MNKTIFYLVVPETQQFFFYETLPEVRAKEKELAKIYGYDATFPDVPKIYHQYKTLKNYYGTVWLAYKWNENGTGAYSIHARWKECKDNRDYGYKIQKFELSPFEESPGADEKSYWLNVNKETKRGFPGVTPYKEGST